jgi:hypothetical protein
MCPKLTKRPKRFAIASLMKGCMTRLLAECTNFSRTLYKQKQNAMIKKMLNQKTFNLKLFTMLLGLIILLFSCNSASNQNVPADNITILSDASRNKIREILVKNFQFPITSNTDASSGHFYVSVIIEKGGKVSNISISESKESLMVPLLISCQLAVISPDTIANRSDFITKNLFVLEEEAIRVTKMIEPLNLPEWKDRKLKFAISFNIKTS